MKLAFISLAKEDPDEGGPIGLLPLFDKMIVEKQVRSALTMAADKIVFLCPTMPGAILQFVDQLKVRDIDAEIVRRASDLVQYASHDNDLVYIGDGILPSPSIEQQMAKLKGEAVYVVANSDIYEDLERIDLNQRWAGLLRLKASRLSALIDIPDDWNIGSALLRISVQAECPREVISDPRMVAGDVIHIENNIEAEEYTRRKLAEPGLNNGNILDRLIFWPITRRLLPKLWPMQNAGLYLGGASIFLALCAAIIAYFQVEILALGLLFVGSVLGLVGSRTNNFAQTENDMTPMHVATDILAKIALLILVLALSTSADMVPNLVILVLYWIILPLVGKVQDQKILRWLKPDKSFPTFVLLISAIFGHFLPGIYFVALWTSLYLGIASYHNPRSDAKPQKSA